jgi:hypothetical protein
VVRHFVPGLVSKGQLPRGGRVGNDEDNRKDDEQAGQAYIQSGIAVLPASQPLRGSIC